MSDTRTTEELRVIIGRGIHDSSTVYMNENEVLANARAALDTLTARLTAYEAEHEAHKAKNNRTGTWEQLQSAHDNAERVIRGDN